MTVWTIPFLQLILLAAGTPSEAKPVPKPAAPELHIVEQKVLEETNATRKRHGLKPLTLDRGLLTSARRHTSWMAKRRSLQHTTAQVAENIAAGQTSARQAVGDWMQSPGHRANILNPGYRRIGIAAYRAKDGTCYWCQQFLR